MIAEFVRVVSLASPQWWLLENVARVPDVKIDGYKVQRITINATEVGSRQNRNRVFQFGSRTGKPIMIPRCEFDGAASRCAMASEGRRGGKRTWADFCELQGLPRDFELPGLSLALKYQLVGNGVPLPLGMAIAAAIKNWLASARWPVVCVCGCGREVDPPKTQATAGCRKRMQRRRDAATVTQPGIVTPATSPDDVTELVLSDPGNSHGGPR